MEIMRKKNQRSGIWFYGLAGTGKTFASERCAQLVQDAFIIDGDVVRKFISFDLGYSKDDRNKQLKRVYGLATIALRNLNFPIISTVFMNKEIFKACKKVRIDVVQIERSLDQVYNSRSIYFDTSNVVGKDISLENLNTAKIFNSGDQSFIKLVEQYVE